MTPAGPQAPGQPWAVLVMVIGGLLMIGASLNGGIDGEWDWPTWLGLVGGLVILGFAGYEVRKARRYGRRW